MRITIKFTTKVKPGLSSLPSPNSLPWSTWGEMNELYLLACLNAFTFSCAVLLWSNPIGAMSSVYKLRQEENEITKEETENKNSPTIVVFFITITFRKLNGPVDALCVISFLQGL